MKETTLMKTHGLGSIDKEDEGKDFLISNETFIENGQMQLNLIEIISYRSN